jgi:hypothetical protein
MYSVRIVAFEQLVDQENAKCGRGCDASPVRLSKCRCGRFMSESERSVLRQILLPNIGEVITIEVIEGQ